MKTKVRSALMSIGIMLFLVEFNQLSVAMEIDINVIAEPSLPATNMIQNSSFEEPVGNSNFWIEGGYYKGKGEITVVANQAHSGGMSVCATGLSDDAQGQMLTQEFYVPTDIPLFFDFWVKADRDLPHGGTVSLRYLPDNKDILIDGVDAQISSVVKIPGKWIQFSNPPKDIVANPSILFWQPRTKDMPRTYQPTDTNVIVFPRDKFDNQDKVKVRLYIIAKGMGVLWYDDIVLKPLKTKLMYTVKGIDVTEIKICNSQKKIIEQKTFFNDWQGEFSGTAVVLADDSYQVEVKTKSGATKYAEYPPKTN